MTTQYLHGYRNGWLDAGIGLNLDVARTQEGEYGQGYRRAQEDRASGRDPRHITFLNHITTN